MGGKMAQTKERRPKLRNPPVIPSHLQREHPMATPGQIALTAPHPARDSADTEAPPRLKSAALVEQGNNFWHIERSLVDEPTRWLQEI